MAYWLLNLVKPLCNERSFDLCQLLILYSLIMYKPWNLSFIRISNCVLKFTCI